MTSLEAMAAYFPPDAVPIESLGEELGLTSTQIKMFRRFYGLAEILRERTGTLTDLMLAAAAKLDALRGRENQIRYVVHARALSTSAPYPVNPLHEVREALGLSHATAFAVTQHACASGLLAIDLCGRLLAADDDPDALALIFTGERAFTPSVTLSPGVTIMGEGAAAILVRHGGDHDRMLSYAVRTHGQFNGGVTTTPEQTSEYMAVHNDAQIEVVLAAVEQAGLTLDDIDLLLPHNVNRVSWVRLCKEIGFPLSRAFLHNVPRTGHCFCADPFINHQTARELGVLQPGHRYIITGAGRGATFAAMVFEH